MIGHHRKDSIKEGQLRLAAVLVLFRMVTLARAGLDRTRHRQRAILVCNHESRSLIRCENQILTHSHIIQRLFVRV